VGRGGAGGAAPVVLGELVAGGLLAVLEIGLL